MSVTLHAHLRIARPAHWVKNLAVLPGLVVALSLEPARFHLLEPWRLLLGCLALCLVTSSNYVLNELLDASGDAAHPIKRSRAVPSGQVIIPLAYAQWIALAGAGLLLSRQLALGFTLSLAGLWIMALLYNVPPLRSKDLPYIDVLTEALNNPLRLLAGWYMTGTQMVPISSLLVSYWMLGCYFMAVKRFAEYHTFHSREQSAAYRSSFAFYTERRLLVSIMFYAVHSTLFLGAFIVRYRLELVLAFPLVALVMAIYLSLAFKDGGAAERPEILHREPGLVLAASACAVLMLLLLFLDVPLIHRLFPPTESLLR